MRGHERKKIKAERLQIEATTSDNLIKTIPPPRKLGTSLYTREAF